MQLGPTRYSHSPTEIEFARYGDGSIAILTVDGYGQPQLKATVCLDGLGAPALQPDQAWIKTWSENEGVLEALVVAGIVTPTGKAFEVNAHGSLAVLVALTPAALAEFKRQEAG